VLWYNAPKVADLEVITEENIFYQCVPTRFRLLVASLPMPFVEQKSRDIWVGMDDLFDRISQTLTRTMTKIRGEEFVHL
jgi:hypothetical protein